MKRLLPSAVARPLLLLCSCVLVIAIFDFFATGAASVPDGQPLAINNNASLPNPPSFFVQQGSEVVIEAEHYDANLSRNGKSWVVNADRTGFAGDAAMVATPDTQNTVSRRYVLTNSPELQYLVQFTTPGTYYVWVRALADNANNDSLHVGLDGQPLASAAEIRFTSYQGWQWRDNRRVYTLQVPSAGVHTVNVWMREDGFRFDRMLLTTNGAYRPNGMGPAESPRPNGNPRPTPTPIPTPTPSPTATPTPAPIPTPSPTPRPTPSPIPSPTPAPTPSVSGQYYVAINGRSNGSGSADDPLDLATALNGSRSPARPGDTIWLRGGVYRGVFTSTLAGNSGAPIIVRAMPGERVTLDSGSIFQSTLKVQGSYTHYRDFEVMKSDPRRVSQVSGSNPTDTSRGSSHGLYVTGRYTKFINLIIHDDGVGIGFWTTAVGSEIYGCIIYNNGWDAPDRGHGHGVYAQNETGTKFIKDSVFFNQFGNGIQIYGSSNASLNNFHLEGNAAFNNGSLSQDGLSNNVLVGGGRVAQNPVLLENYTYFPSSGRGGANKLGYSAGCQNATVTNNYFAGRTILQVRNCGDAAINGNMMYGDLGTLPGQFPNNSYFGQGGMPPVNQVFVRPNLYEPGRAHIIVYNWERDAAVEADLSGVLPTGTPFEVRNVQDYFGAPVLTGTYNGGPVRLPMTGLRVVNPVGVNIPPRQTGPEFNVFVVVPLP